MHCRCPRPSYHVSGELQGDSCQFSLDWTARSTFLQFPVLFEPFLPKDWEQKEMLCVAPPSGIVWRLVRKDTCSCSNVPHIINVSNEPPMPMASKALAAVCFPAAGSDRAVREAVFQASSQPPICGLQENSETSLSDAPSLNQDGKSFSVTR
ncbi:hypothetical protein BJY04DRAFT_92885 [Aspergillus karnatakaensis]|uniref:uncharacterized protein n=1 Tax=Aspergillus karnatakaensis TaxID=1810916 RepID=UPI003CCDA422